MQKKNWQPNFFEPESKSPDEKARMNAGKCVVRRLLTIRRELLAADDREYIHFLNDAIKAIRSEANYSAAQIEKIILNSVEKNKASTFEEIADDTRLSIEAVKQIVHRLESENILEITSKATRSTSGLIFSKRKSDVEVT